MATRKALVLVSGLFQELNSSSDKLDFAGNSTSDLSEGTNEYFTQARARGSVSVASGNGLTYNSSTGVFGTSAIPNSQLANDDITIGSTAVALGATQGTFTGLTSLASTTLISGVADAANAITIASGQIVFEGATANDFETTLAVTDPTADRTITFPDNGGTVALTSDIVYPVTLNNSVTLTNKTLALGSNTISGTFAQFNTAVTDATLVSTTGSETLTNKSVNLANNTLTGTFAQFNTAVSDATLVSTTGTETLTNKSLTAPVLTGSASSAGSIIFKEDTDNGTNSATLVGPASTADVTITLPAETGTVLTTATSILNGNLANSSITIGTTGINLGGSITTFVGMASITSTAVVTNDSGFRIRDNSDNTKQLAFECSGISTSTTRTLTVPDENGTLVTSGAIVNADINASAAIAGTKISPNFGSQNITTTGTFGASHITVTSAAQPAINLVDSSQDPDYSIINNNGTFGIYDITNAAYRFNINTDGHVDVTGNLDVGAGLDVTGNITVSGTVDGVDVATRDTLFGGLTSSSGALTNGVTATTQSASDNSTKVATTAYVDNQVTSNVEFSDNTFRVKDNSDASKKLAFECSGISGSTTRTMTVPNTDGTISTESFATAIAVALG